MDRPIWRQVDILMGGSEGGVSEYHHKATRRILDIADDGEYRKSTGGIR
jgi:hypothetical protein